MKKKQRRRVDRERVKSNAAEAGGGGLAWLRAPKGISAYHPEKAGSVKLDILPYEVKTQRHPDRVEPGTLWYKYPFSVHRSIGINNDDVVCPVSVGKRCPICEERTRLAKEWDENKETIRTLTAQKWVAYNIFNPEDSDEVCIFLFSRGKFAEFLENELLEGDEVNLNFYDVTDEGRTLKVRFTEDAYEGRKFLKATRIDFVPREALDEDEVLSKVACLDEIFHVYEYEVLERMFSGHDEEETEDVNESEDGDGEEMEDVPVNKKSESKSKSKKKVEEVEEEVVEEAEEEEEEDLDFDDEEEDEEDEPEEEEEAPPPKSKKSKSTAKPKPKPKKIEEEEEEDFDDEEDED